MAILRKTALVGQVQSVLVHRAGSDDISSAQVEKVSAGFDGLAGDSHSGVNRASCVRVAGQYVEGTPIRNTRQISLVSIEELALIAEAMQIDFIQPEWLGANLCLSGIPDLTLLPPSTRLIFSSGASVAIDMENEPCRYPADIIDRHYPGKGRMFVKNAMNRRGLTGWVEREGDIAAGDKVAVHMPPNRLYPMPG
jgi:MOSC domain-containing protein YiiM